MTLAYNEPITFGRGGNAEALNCIGIDFSDDGGRSWTCDQAAEMDIQLPFARQDIALHLDAAPFVVDDLLPSQNVFIFLGGLFVGFDILRGHKVRSFPINRATVSGRVTRLCLVIPTAISPKALDVGEDMRKLGIYLKAITFKTVMPGSS